MLIASNAAMQAAGAIAGIKDFVGFVLNAQVRMTDIVRLYGLRPEFAGDLTLGQYAAQALHGCPLPGDKLTLGGACLTVLTTTGLCVERLGLSFPAAAIRATAAARRKPKAAREVPVPA